MSQFIRDIDAGTGGAHQSYPLILADMLDDVGDPRSLVIRRAHERPDPITAVGSTFAGKTGYHLRDDHRINSPFGGITFDVIAKNPYRPNSRAKRELVTRAWFPSGEHDGRGIEREAFTSPDEARAIVDAFDDETVRTNAHAFLDRHFGARPTTASLYDLDSEAETRAELPTATVKPRGGRTPIGSYPSGPMPRRPFGPRADDAYIQAMSILANKRLGLPTYSAYEDGDPSVNYADQHDIVSMLAQLRRNPYDETRHGVLADALEEVHGSPIANLIRRQYGFGQDRVDNNWYEPFGPGDARTNAPLGNDAGFDLYLGHVGQPGQAQNWFVRATHPRLRDYGYTFEFPHEEAHLIPQMFPAAAEFIDPEDRDQYLHEHMNGGGMFVPKWQHRAIEASRFDDEMDRRDREQDEGV